MVTAPSVSTVTLAAEPSAASAARRFVAEALSDAVPPTVVADLQLITSELFTNAVEHGSNDAVDVTVVEGPTDAAVCVESSGDAADVGPPHAWEIPESAAIVGRGLGIVRELADELSVVRDAQRLIVTASRLLPQPE